MAISVVLPANGGFDVIDLLGIIDFIATESEVSSVLPNIAVGTGFYDGEAISFSLIGSGFTLGIVGGEPSIVAGTLEAISFNSPTNGTVAFSDIGIDMAVFSPIIQLDVSGVSPTAIEDFLLARDWNVVLGNNDDIASRGTIMNDGVEFNLMGDDIIHGLGGNDNLYSGDGNDKLFGDSGDDRLDGGNGRDVVKGGSGNDKLIGSGGNDKLFGDTGRDNLKGGAGKDDLDGGKGNDVLTGGAGADKFVFKNNGGRDKIKDFNATNNKEDIDLGAVTRIKSFKDLKNNHMDQDGANVVIDDHNGTKIVLIGVDIGDLGKADFLF